MELDDEDSRNGAGSKDAGRGPIGSIKFNEKRGGTIESIEPNKEVKALFIPFKLLGINPKDVKQTPKKQEPLKQKYIKSEPGTNKS